MKRGGIALFALASLAMAADRHDERNWKVKDEETIQRSLDVSAASGGPRLLVDNISGFVHVTGGAGKQIEVNVQRHTGAVSNEALAEAKRDVKLDVSQQGNFVRLYVDGPFRNHDGVNYRGDEYYGYRVTFDYEIRVPAATEVVLKTINNGDIVVKNISGDFQVNGLNGGIEMSEISGSGSVGTLNGPVKVAFSRNPQRKTEFHTLNGKVDVYFQPTVDADLNFKTLNGGVYADFEILGRPTQTAAGETRNGKFVYSSRHGAMSGRAGKGGPELTFQTLNGDIRLHSKTQ